MEFSFEGGTRSASLAEVNEYVAFKQFVCSSFGLSKCVTSYVDVDGDSVTIGNQADLDEALAYMAEEELKKLSVKVVGTKAEYEIVDVTKPAKKFTVEDAAVTLIEMMQEWTIATNEDLAIDLKQGFFNILLDPSFIDCWNQIVFDSKSPFNEYANAILTAICKHDVMAANELLNRADELGDLVNHLFRESPQTSKLLATALPSLVKHFASLAAVDEAIIVEEVVEPTVESVNEQIDDEEEEKAPAPSTVVHSHRICDGCGMYPLVGVRHQSEKDRNLDFCSACVVLPRFQTLSPFRAIETELVVHYNIECDGCGAAPVEGVRYKSAITNDYDLCMLCEASGKFTEHEPFIKITTPEKAAALKKKNKPASVPAVHMNIQCDGCNKHPIVGARYKSAVIKEFDLCESCEASGAYNESHGPFLKITNIDQTPFALYVATEKMHRDGTEPKETPHEFTSRVQSTYGGCSPPRCWRGSRRHPKPHRGPIPPFNCGIPPPPPPPFAPLQGHRGHRRPPMDKPEPYLRSRFVEDITIPDGTVCAPGQSLTKKWRLQNNGNNAWPEGCEVQVVGGMGIVAQAPIPVPPLAPGEDFVLSVDVQAPLENGRFVCYFRVCSPSGSRFGHRFWVDLVVDNSIPCLFEESIPSDEDKEEIPSSSEEHDDVSSIPMATLVIQDEAPEVTIEPQLQSSEPTETTQTTSIEEPRAAQDSEVVEATTEKDTYEFATQLEELMLMGFTDEELNRSLLNHHNGNLERLIEILLQETLTMKSLVLVLVGAIASAAQQCTSALDGQPLDLSWSPALINDDFCDCLDGSDEPATSACSYLTNAMHECHNHGLLTTSIHTGQVNDGICDCCDGSDEPLGVCEDTCEAAIESKRVLIQKHLDSVQAGYAERNKRLEAMKQADIDKQVDIKAKQSLVQELRQLAQKVTVFKDKEERTEFAMRVEAAKNKEDDNKCAVDAKEESPVEEPSATTAPMSDDAVELTESRAKTKLSLTVNRLDGRKMSLSAYMNDVLDQAKRIPIRSVHQRRKEDFLGPLFNGDHKDRVRILTYGLQGIGLVLSPIRGVYEVFYFISSKAMDLVHALMPQFIYDPWQTFLELLELDWSYHKSIALRRLSQGRFFWWRYYASWVFDTIWDAPVEVVWETFFPTLDTSVVLPEAESLREILSEIQSDITAIEQEIDRLQRVETVEYGEDEGFQILKGACAVAQIEKYYYKICPFGEATQDNVRLGTWKAWKSYSPPIMSFEGGQKCWNGPERSVQLKLECGEHDEIASVDELSTCVYTVLLKTPAACTSSLLQSAQDEAKKWLISN